MSAITLNALLIVIATGLFAGACTTGTPTTGGPASVTSALSPGETFNAAHGLADMQRYGDAIDVLSELLATRPLTAEEAANARQMRAELYLQSPDCMVDLATDDLAYALESGALPPDREQAARLALADITTQGAAACSVNSSEPRNAAGPVFDRACYARLDGYGAISLRFDVDSTGMPTNILVKDTTDDCMVDPSVLALSQMRFDPRIQNGEIVPRQGMEVLFRAGEQPR